LNRDGDRHLLKTGLKQLQAAENPLFQGVFALGLQNPARIGSDFSLFRHGRLRRFAPPFAPIPLSRARRMGIVQMWCGQICRRQAHKKARETISAGFEK
jgi:hypothetical protein